MMMTDEPVMLDTPEQIQMFALLQCRGRLQLELKGLRFKQSTIRFHVAVPDARNLRCS
jgi:hypothetical protein